MTIFLRTILTMFICGFGLLQMSSLANAETPFPTIHEPSDESLKCIHPEEEMRRNHMNYILHQRDITMHKGVRTEENSLAKCIDCHVQPNEKGEIASVDTKEHFCNGCHEYASVQIDCFQCHADRPQKFIKRGDHNSSSHNSSLAKQLQNTLAAAHSDTHSMTEKK